MHIQEMIKQQIDQHKVLLFMKGTVTMPLCGFSARAVNILKELNVAFAAVNVLENADMREAIKVYSNWPTIPQLYINGEFIGGCDIMSEMYENGELKSLLTNTVTTE